jgi:hypothetical protein
MGYGWRSLPRYRLPLLLRGPKEGKPPTDSYGGFPCLPPWVGHMTWVTPYASLWWQCEVS